MTGPKDEDLDVGIFDDEKHADYFGQHLDPCPIDCTCRDNVVAELGDPDCEED